MTGISTAVLEESKDLLEVLEGRDGYGSECL